MGTEKVPVIIAPLMEMFVGVHRQEILRADEWHCHLVGPID
jgi:hypothetical protein